MKHLTLLAIFLLIPALASAQHPAAPPEEPGARKPELIRTLPGIDTTVMTEEEREELIRRANETLCTCGCTQTLAYALNHHPGCSFPKPLVSLLACEISPNFKKVQSELDLINWPKYRNPQDHLKCQFDWLAGFELDALSDRQRELFLLKANTLPSACGDGDTLAKCNNNHPNCPLCPTELRRILAEIKSAAATAE